MVCAMEFVRYLHLIHYVGFVGAQLLNSLLVYLIVVRSQTTLGNYRYAMLVFTLCSMFYSWVEIFVQPVAHMKGSMYVVFMHSSILSLTNPLGSFLNCLHCVLSGFVASLLACQFIYRYLALCKTHLLTHLQGKNLCIIFTPALFVYTVWHIGVFHGMPNTVEKQLYLHEELMTCFKVNSFVTPFVGPMYWSLGENGEVHWKLLEMLASLSLSAVLVACFFTIIFCALKIYTTMKNSKHHFSAKTLDLNKQLFRMLCIQTVIPMFTMYTPVALFVILPMFGKDIPYLGNLTSSSLAIYPLLEPIIAITCIASFRNTVMRTIHCIYSRQSRLSIFPSSGSKYSIGKPRTQNN